MILGIVGSGADKFTSLGEMRARRVIARLICNPRVTGVCSGESPLGGIDIWTHEMCDTLNIPFVGYKAGGNSWEFFKSRNRTIATVSDEVHCLVADAYPQQYTGRRFELCYHCQVKDHIKSGGCWTMLQATRGWLHIVCNSGEGAVYESVRQTKG